MNVRDVRGMRDFQAAVLDESYSRPVAVDFWAPWCAPCRVLGPVLEKLAGEFQGDFLLAKVNTEENLELAAQFEIRSIPNVKVFKDGAVVDEFMGAVSEAEARRFLRAHCPTPADRRYAEAKELLESDRPEQARPALEQVLELEPAHPGALLELGRLEAGEGETASARALWERIPAHTPEHDAGAILIRTLQFRDKCRGSGGIQAVTSRVRDNPGDVEARFALGCCLAAEGDFRAALEEFLHVVGRDRSYGEDAARKSMLSIFALVGERSELAEEYRKRLAMTLF